MVREEIEKAAADSGGRKLAMYFISSSGILPNADVSSEMGLDTGGERLIRRRMYFRRADRCISAWRRSTMPLEFLLL